MTTPDTTAPVAPFGATVAGVLGVVPEARLVTDDDLAAGRYGVTATTVLGWLEALSARVSRRLDGWEQLEATAVDDGDALPDRELLIRDARDLVHQGAGSYLEAARFPERAGVADTSYAAVLWQRFEAGLDELYAWLERRVDTGTGDDVGGTTAPSLAYGFPEPSFTPGRLIF